ncbi:MAG: hypothetical protein H6739_40840 [Alphaproteobacteria bacterium]|nr:hypothetical protein [Alphaproteobacteria bacterium]
MNAYRLDGISTVRQGVYAVHLIGGIGDETHRVAFEMTVEESPFNLLSYGDDFAAFVEMRTGPLKPLFEAVLRFHLATRLAIHGRAETPEDRRGMEQPPSPTAPTPGRDTTPGS